MTDSAETKRLVLVVDDEEKNARLLSLSLKQLGFKTHVAHDGQQALDWLDAHTPDVVLTDIEMPRLNGLQLCRAIRERPETKSIPLIVISSLSSVNEIATGFEAGADDYLSKPFQIAELKARLHSMMRIRDAQVDLHKANARLAELNAELETRVQQQVLELERTNRLRRFFSPQIVETITSDTAEEMLSVHRREITVVFFDMRNFSAFAEQFSPEDVMQVLREFHAMAGPVIFNYQGTLERFTGDGMMVFMGDPNPVPDHPLQAVEMAAEVLRRVEGLQQQWCSKGYDLGLSAGLATGVASLGSVGYEGRFDYAAIGVVTNLAARICARANSGQILIAESCFECVRNQVTARSVGEFMFNGFSQPQHVFEVVWSEAGA